MTDFIETASAVSPFRVESDFGNGFVRLRSEEAERRQAAQDIRCTEDIIIEALRNSRDAHARSIFLATSKEGAERHIVVVDDGDGVPVDMHDHIFEPRVTSKLNSMRMDKWGVHGRGMALFSIAENCVSTRVVQSDLTLGSSFEFVSDTTKLKEKTDQSTFPSFYRTDGNTVTVRGPRTSLELRASLPLRALIPVPYTSGHSLKLSRRSTPSRFRHCLLLSVYSVRMLPVFRYASDLRLLVTRPILPISQRISVFRCPSGRVVAFLMAT